MQAEAAEVGRAFPFEDTTSHLQETLHNYR